MNPSTDQSSFLTAQSSRRHFLRRALGASAGAALVPAALSLAGGNARADETSDDLATDLLVLNFALNLEYLEAEFYSRRNRQDDRRQRRRGRWRGHCREPPFNKTTGSPQVPFQTPAIQQYALEISGDETHHVEAHPRHDHGAGFHAAGHPEHRSRQQL